MSKAEPDSITEGDNQHRNENDGWRRALIALLFLFLSFLCLFCSSQSALYLIDRDKVLGDMRSHQQADYGVGPLIALAPLDREGLLTEVAADHLTLGTPQAPIASGIVIVPLPRETLIAEIPTLVPPIPTLTPTPTPTFTPTPTPETVAEPTDEPTAEPTAEPTSEPTEEPTGEPTAEPTSEPTAAPTEEPTAAPTEEPTAIPTEAPTEVPTEVPTPEPPEEPTEVPSNKPPDANNDVVAVDEDSGPNLIDVLANDDDPDGTLQPATVVIVTSPAHGSATVDPATGAIIYTPFPDFFGEDMLEYRVCDNDGDCVIASLFITVTAIPDLPIAIDDLLPTFEETAVIIPVLNNDDDPDGDLLTVIAITPPISGVAVINPDNTVTYTPGLNFDGTDIFTYTIDDGLFTATARVTVPITGLNESPIALPDLAVTAEDTSETVLVLANDSDPDGDPLTIISIGTPMSGTTTHDSSSITYIPFPDVHGTDVFTYTISDGFTTSTTTVTVDITSINDPPLASNDVYITSFSAQPLIEAAPGVLSNDTDIEGDPLTASLVGPPASGTLILNPDGSLTYTAVTTGTYSFTYQANDSLSASNIATVIINVLP